MVSRRQILNNLVFSWFTFISIFVSSKNLQATGKVSFTHFSADSLLVSVCFENSETLFGENENSKLLVANRRANIYVETHAREIDFQILNLETDAHATDVPVSFVDDVPVGLSDLNGLIKPQSTFQNVPVVKTFFGRFENKNVFQFQIFSCLSGKTDREVECIKSVEMLVTGAGVERFPDSLRISEKFLYPSDESISRTPAIKKVKMENKTNPADNIRMKIFVNREGMYRLSRSMIKDCGWDVLGVDPRYFRITCAGAEMPIRVTGEEDGAFNRSDCIEFYGEPLWDRSNPDEIRLDVYATDNVYWLEIGDVFGRRLLQEEAEEKDANDNNPVFSLSSLFTKHVEEDNYFYRLPYLNHVTAGDYWFYSSGIVGYEKRDFQFSIDAADIHSSLACSLRLKINGQSENQKTQPFDVFLNNRLLFSDVWIGNQTIVIESPEFTPFNLQDENVLSLLNRSVDGPLAQIRLDWFEITYPKRFEEQDDYIRFCAPQNSAGRLASFQIKGFNKPDISLFKKNFSRIFKPEITSATDTSGQISYTLSFRDMIINAHTEYVAVASSAFLTPDSLSLVDGSSLSVSDTGADYVVIVPDDSLGEEILAPWIQLRENQGLSVRIVNLHHIYDAFHYGIPNPDAIRQFLRFANLNWVPSPQFVLLVGDGYYDNRVSTKMGNLIPVPFFQTVNYGGAPSDNQYALLTGDDQIPDIAIGRLPVQNRSELANILQKIIEYELTASGSWRNTYLLIGAGGHDDVFYEQSENLICDILPHRFEPERLYLAGSISDPYVGGTEDLLRHFRDGVAWVNFRGHGGGAIWSDGGLLDLDDIELIENRQRLPIVTSMTCFTSDFSSSRTSIGEAMLLQKDAGAVAFLGATGLGWVWNDFYFLTEFSKILKAEPELPVGKIIMRAKAAYMQSYSGDLPESVVNHLTLLGDPALRFGFPDETATVTLENRSIISDDSLRVSGISSSDGYQLNLSVTGQDYSGLTDYQWNQTQSSWNVKIPLPETFNDPNGGARVYLWNRQTGYQASGFVSFAFEKTYFDSIAVYPEKPTSHDSLYFSVFAEDRQGIGKIECHILYPVPDTLEMAQTNVAGFYITTQPFGPLDPGRSIQFFFTCEDGDGNLSNSETTVASILQLPDFSIQSVSLDGNEHVVLKTIVFNEGEEDVDSLVIHYACPQFAFSVFDTLSLTAGRFDTLFTPFTTASGSFDLQVAIDPDTMKLDRNRNNNFYQKTIVSDLFDVTPKSGIVTVEGVSDTVEWKDKIRCYVPPEAVGQHTVLRLGLMTENQIRDAGIPFLTNDEIYQIAFLNFSNEYELVKEVDVFILADTTVTGQLYRWNHAIKQWMLHSSERTNTRFWMKTTKLGYFKLYENSDTEPPRVELQVNNQPFSSGSYVPKNSLITIAIQDQSGIDTRSGKLEISLDNIIQDPNSFIMATANDDPSQVSILLRPLLETGEHVISTKVSDIHGNTTQSENIDFIVDSQFDIQFLGNHPNPFNVQTVFVYVLTDAAKKVSLKIYTTSGKLIRIFDDYEMAAADYHEIVWDGRDDWGERVANGVYFFRLKAKGYQKNREITGKIAVIR